MEIQIDSKRKVNLNLDNANSYMARYKNYILPVFVIFACFLVFFLVVLPQFQNYIKSRDELETENQKLQVLKNNYNFLTSLDEQENNNDFKILSIALPQAKDFTGIINALSAAASKTGVGIGDFSFSLGDLAKTNDLGVTSTPSIKLEINLSGNAKLVTNFINELYKTAPVSEIVTVKTNLDSSNLVILFYYKPFPPQNVSDEAQVEQISPSNLKLLKEIYSWNNIDNQQIFIPFISSSSSASGSSSGETISPF